MKAYVFTLLLFFCCEVAVAQAPLVKQWDYRFGGTNLDNLSSLQQTNDNGYILGGTSSSDSSGDKTQHSWAYLYATDYWVVKIDPLGIKQWDKRFGGKKSSTCTSLQQTIDGGFVLGGYSYSGIFGDKTQPNWDTTLITYDYWVIKIDSFGNKQWDKRFGGISDDYLMSLDQTSDGGYILGGYSASDNNGDKTQTSWGPYDYWVVKIDLSGNKQWDKRFGGTSDDRLYSLQQTTDRGYIFGGYSYSDSSGDKTQPSRGAYDYWIVKTDSVGNKQWDKRYGGTSWDDLYSLQQTTDGGYILGGTSWSDISGDKTEALRDTSPLTGAGDFWLIKIDSFGIKQWDKTFGGVNKEDEFGNISQTADGGYLVAGASYSGMSGDKSENNPPPPAIEQTWVIKTDWLGNKEWDKTIFTTEHDEFSYAIQTKDGCYAIANSTFGGIGGYKTQPNWRYSDYWLIKFCDTTSTVITGINNLAEEGVVRVYPNPLADGGWQLTVGNNFVGGIAEVFDANGRLVFQSAIRNPKSEIAPALSRGVYLLRISSAKSSVVRKLVRL